MARFMYEICCAGKDLLDSKDTIELVGEMHPGVVENVWIHPVVDAVMVESDLAYEELHSYLSFGPFHYYHG